MDDLEEKIQAVLNDPQQMQIFLSRVRSDWSFRRRADLRTEKPMSRRRICRRRQECRCRAGCPRR